VETKLKRKDVASSQPANDAEQSLTARGPSKHKRLGMVLKQRYRIVSLIASGGTSDVYKATDLYLEKAGTRDAWVAIKILRSELIRDAGALALLARETAKSKRLSHPNIIRVQDLDHDGDTWFMVMELLEGEPLSRVVQRAKPRGLQWKGGQAVLEQIVSALAFSHRSGVIHADLKPSNIYVTREGTIKLLDFGVAHALAPHQPQDFLNPHSDDETTIYGYTPAYASPSLIAGRDPTEEDDLYALACIAFELLSSRHPFGRKKLSQSEQSTYRLERPQNMPRRVWAIVHGLLRAEAQGPDLDAFQAALMNRHWGPVLYSAGLAAMLVFAALIWHQESSRALKAEAQLTIYNEQKRHVERIKGESPGQLLASVQRLPPLERAGLLKLNQKRIIDHYRGLVKQTLQTAPRPDLPNIPGALEVLARALALFPQNQVLLLRQTQLQQQNASLQAALKQEIEGALEHGDYRSFEALEELKRLAGDLEFLDAQELAPAPAALAKFQAQLSEALADNNGAELARLLQVADLFHSETPELQELLGRAREMEGAVAMLGAYHQALASGAKTPFPENAAAEFYADHLTRWHAAIDGAANSRTLDGVYAEFIVHQQGVPAAFRPFSDLREKLADAYVTQAENLLAKNGTRQAKPLLKKATQLMRQN
tara:strand:+ start:1341 stop:3305 length:1965 start_codon:yes stop_codon:yes gene_type:complete